jgi:hypothetical protein
MSESLATHRTMVKQQLRDSSGILAVVASETFYRDVISQKSSPLHPLLGSIR